MFDLKFQTPNMKGLLVYITVVFSLLESISVTIPSPLISPFPWKSVRKWDTVCCQLFSSIYNIYAALYSSWVLLCGGFLFAAANI